jgi:hypothetical protein
MEKWIASLVFGLVLAGGGAAAVIWHVRSWHAKQADPSLTAQERTHYHRQYRRRTQTSSLIVLLGVLFPIGDSNGFIPWDRHPLAWTLFWFFVLGLTLWVMLLALGDLASTRTHTRDALNRLREQQRELEREAARLRSRSTNGPRGI